MYFNSYSIEADKQGRITLPKNLFRSGGIERGGIICIYFSDGYWIACDPGRLQAILEQDYPGSALDPDIRDDRRNFMLDVRSLHIDPQGRIPFQSLQESPGDSQFVIIGTGLEFEIWAQQVWQERYGKPGGEKR
ncbi:hypothetical protein JW823_01230 [bacterium]|nr:hypothetical protein [candidate division CSSED10-310 bacterium]